MKRQSLESDIRSKLRSISVKAGHRLVLSCPTYVHVVQQFNSIDAKDDEMMKKNAKDTIKIKTY